MSAARVIDVAADPMPCPMASLVEARRDGRLGEREAASLARHLGTCTACRDLERDLDEVRDLLRRSGGPPLTALEHQRNRLALLRAAAAPHPAPPNPPRAQLRMARGAVVVGALALAVGLALPRGDGAAVITMVGAQGPPQPLIARHLPAMAHLQREQSSCGPPESVPRRRGPYPTETTLRGSAEARFEQGVGQDGVERVSLHEGTLDLSVRKLAPGERFLVATDDAEVEVRGTVFEVEAHGGRIASVTVSEGKVEVRYRRALSIVAAGGAWRPPEETAAESTRDEASRGARRSLTFTTRSSVVAAGSTGGSPEAGRPAGHRWGLSPQTPGAGDGNDASKVFGAAVDMLGRGDYAAARTQLDAFRAAHPADARADLAAFLTIVSLQRAGRRTEAQEAARRYLELYPDGDRRAEAARVASGR